ncbi:NAD(P)/FAD-dependent oxidoreductase [Luteimonas sp. MC1750]|uniref:FAD-dependent oxidoreductase n=1 Tax=Luteimonas sp. MC1750 TaxID=2799326 RepID=UPI0018F0D9F3|nr:NAD(P)/FAD-dependent oxidoreductase [Luteimonas sp. MC1750]MBJ6984591.1 FAD-dependent monooxygenase [Luteimonas sp. MC1750]QQO07259.1 FAD-dependent monooxygenase [Luteimonas sp. MC1750]
MIGAGLAGALMATLLAQRGWTVEVYESRGDPRLHGFAGGRSINLALAERGLHALRAADADRDVLAQAVMMRGRMVHPRAGTPQLQRYGRDDREVIWSVSRGELNVTLINAAEAAGATIHFDRRLEAVDFPAKRAFYRGGGELHRVGFSTLIGCDGAGSSLRAQMHARTGLGERTEWLGHGYKELEIPPAADGGFRIEPNALHIWPRGRYMCIALPNDERTFTVTLFMALEDQGDGDPSFETVPDAAAALALFERDFADALPLIPELVHDFEANPIGTLGTLYLDRWHLGGDAVLIGDAAHAMVPFHGQGMNCAFEDCVALAGHLDATPDLATAYAAFEAQRMPDATAIQKMALDNYIEMRDLVDDPGFLLQRELELALQARHPTRFIPHYAMVTFMRIPYSLALERSEIQRRILEDATRGRASLAGIDIPALDGAIEQALAPLDAGP